MQITDLVQGEPLCHTIYGERYLNDSKGRFENYSEVDPRFDPQSKCPYVQNNLINKANNESMGDIFNNLIQSPRNKKTKKYPTKNPI